MKRAKLGCFWSGRADPLWVCEQVSGVVEFVEVSIGLASGTQIIVGGKMFHVNAAVPLYVGQEVILHNSTGPMEDAAVHGIEVLGEHGVISRIVTNKDGRFGHGYMFF